MLQVPAALTKAVPSTVTPSKANNVMVSPGVPIPLMAGLVLLVWLSPSTPLSPLALKAATGAVGAVVSITALSLALVAPTLPATSVSVALTVRVLPSPGLAKLVVMKFAVMSAAVNTIVLVLVPLVTVKVSPALAPAARVTLTST